MRTAALSFVIVASLANSAALAQTPAVTDLGLLPGELAIGPADNSQQDLSVARGGDVFLAAWTDLRARSSGSQTVQSDTDIFGIRLDRSGTPIDAAPFLIAGGMGYQQRPHVAWNGENWLVLYESQDPSGGYFDTFIRAVRVSAQGFTLDESPLSFPPDLFSPSTIGLTVSGQGGQWLVARCVYHASGYGTYLAGQRIAGNGQLIDAAPVMLNDWVYGALTVIPSDGEYVVIGPDWNDGAILKARRISASLQPLAPSFNLPPGALDVAGDGSGFYVTWIAGFVNLVGSRMTSTGTLLNPAGTLLVPNFAGESSLTHDGVNWWLMRSVSNLAWTMRINAAGALLDPAGGVPLPIIVTGGVNSLYNTQIIPRSGGGVLFGWMDYRAALGSDSNCFAMPVSPENLAGAEACLSSGTRNQRTSDLSAGPGGTMALAYVSELANDDRVMVRLLDASGNPTSLEPIEIAQAPAIGSCGIAWNGSLFMITWDSGPSGLNPYQVWARRMLPDGTFVDAPTLVMPGMFPAIEALGEDFLIACTRYATYPQFIDLWAKRLDGPTGASQDGPNGLPLAGGYFNGMPRVRSDGTQWLVAAHSMWTHDSSQGDAVLARVPAVGTPAPAFNPTPFSGGSGDLDIAFSGSKYLLVWRMNSLANANNYIAGRLMNADGTYPGGWFIIAEAPGRQLRPTVAWDGAQFVVAWDDQRNQASFFDARTDIYATRVSQAGVVLDASAFAVVSTSAGEAGASVLSPSVGRIVLASTRFTNTPTIDSYRVGLTRITLAATLGDINGDGIVNIDDLLATISAWGACPAPPTACPADVNQDGQVNIDDLLIVINNWG